MLRQGWHFAAVIALLVTMSEIRISAATDDHRDEHLSNVKDLEIEANFHNNRVRVRRDAKVPKADYDCNVPPVFGGDNKPTEVQVGIYIIHFQFTEISNAEITFYFRQSWKDKRLQFKGPPDRIMMSAEGGPCIWTPDAFFRNALEVKDHKLPSKNTMTRLSEDGKVWMVKKLSVKSTCSLMNARRFPFDSGSCSLIIESFAYTADVLHFVPLGQPGEFGLQPGLPAEPWIITNTDSLDCSQNYTTGLYPCLELSLTVTRQLGFYIFKVHLPSALLVVLSWLPLLIGAKYKLTAKLLPGLFAELGLIGLGSFAYEGTRELSVVTAMHIWMGFSHILVLLSILTVIVLHKIVSCRESSTEASTCKIESNAGRNSESRPLNKSCLVDMIAVVVFIVIYILFNIFYWSINTSMRGNASISSAKDDISD